jgi:preprotein translocase subunit SecD
MNRYPLWRYLLLVFLILFGLVYAAPNVFGDDFAIQISSKNTSTISLDPAVQSKAEQALATQGIAYLSAHQETDGFVLRFPSADNQLKAQDVLKATLGEDYIVALNLAPRTPAWLQKLGAHPMKLGLDLRGGINFLLAVDLDQMVKARQNGDLSNMTHDLRQNNIRYAAISRDEKGNLQIEFRDAQNQDKALSWLTPHYLEYKFTSAAQNGQWWLTAALTPEAFTTLTNYAVDQNTNILRNRVNELGVSEAVVQRQGQDKISIDLPGVQDTARAKDLIGKTATLRFQLVDVGADLQSAMSGVVPLGSRLYQYEGTPVVLKNQVILAGNSITYATATIGADGRPTVTVRLGGGGESLFSKATAENIQKPLATVYLETNTQTHMVNGKPVVTRAQTEKIINIAVIQSALGNNFEITGLSDMKYAQNLALLLRSGALAANVSFIQERTIGPTLGAANIHKGILSVVVGSLAVILFMVLYYRLFGLIADLALLLNIVFIVAILSILGATLTLPGIAGIVLTVGIAVDANF